MQLIILGTGSSGNCYLLKSTIGETLILEAGVGINIIKKGLQFNIENVVGCLVTHEHGDHAKSIGMIADAGIDVYASKGTLREKNMINSHRAKVIKSQETFVVGSFRILPFGVKHDCAEPLGFLINHAECGNLLFLTDTMYSPHRFRGLNNIMIEANYCKSIIDKKVKEGNLELLRNRVVRSHMSIQTCIDTLKANDLRAVSNIVLIHLSDSNSNESEFKLKAQQASGRNVYVASSGMIINLNKTAI